MKFVYPEPNTGCWLWAGNVNRKGYGNTGKIVNGYKIRGAHRISYYLHNGPFDYNLNVCHTCDTPCCVNPSHLFLGTNQENTMDMVLKGRSAKGSKTSKAVFVESDISIIKKKFDSGISCISIAKEYGVHRSTVYGILKNKYWKHV